MSGFRQLSVKGVMLAGVVSCIVALVVFVRQFMHWTSTEQWVPAPVSGWVGTGIIQFIPSGWPGMQKGVLWFLRQPVTLVLILAGLLLILIALKMRPRH